MQRQHSVRDSNYKIKKSSALKTLDKPYFMAKLKEDINFVSIKENNEKIFGEDIIFEKRKKKAKLIFEEIEKIDLNESKNNETIKNKIYKALSYDNIDKENLYKSMVYFSKMNDKDGFMQIMNKAKYALTKKFTLINSNNNEQIINLSKELNISKDIMIFESEKDLINEFKNILKSLESLYDEIKDSKMEALSIEKILKNKVVINDKNQYVIEQKFSNDETIQKIYDYIYNFLFYYNYINDFQDYGINQPIDYNYNATIYIINLFNRLYYNTTKLIKKGKTNFVSIDEKQMIKINFLKKLEENIFYLLEKNNNIINQQINEKFELYLFYLESDKLPDDLEEIIDKSLKCDTPLDSEKIKNILTKNKNKNKIFKIKNNILSLEFKGKKYDFKYKNYNEKLLECLLAINDSYFIEQGLWNPITMINYFDDDDISFMKDLIKQILKSKLFKEIYNKYSNIENYADYYFNEDENINDLIDRIKFFAFEETNTGRQAATIPKELKIITSSKNVSKIIQKKKDFINFKLLEVGRKLIILIHEITHFIKRALNLITNGKVLESTIETEKEDPNIIECGRFFESIIFNWDNPFVKKRSQSSKKRNLIKEEESLKILNIQKALKLLDANTYNKNIDNFKKFFYDEEDIKEEDMNEVLRQYLKTINFDIFDYYKNKDLYKSYRINCSRKAESNYTIEYISENHNFPYHFNKMKLSLYK